MGYMTQPEMLETMQGCHPTSAACPAKVSVLKEARNLILGTRILFRQQFILFVPSFPEFLALCYSREPSRFLGPFIADDCISMDKCISTCLK